VIGILSLVAFVWNALTLYVLWWDNKVHQQSKNTKLVLKLVTVDMLLSLINSPIFLLNMAYNGWFAQSVTCPIVGFTTILFNGMSILLITVIAFERYMVLTKGEFPYTTHCMVIVVCLPLLCAILGINHYVLLPSGISCGNEWEHLDSLAAVQSIFVVIVLTGALILVVYFYIWIFRVIARPNPNETLRREMRLSKQMFLLVICFYCCWGPMDFLYAYQVYNTSIFSWDTFEEVAVMIIYLHPILNPALYAYFNPRIRTQLWNVLCCGQLQLQDENVLSLTELPTLAMSRDRINSN